MLVASELVTNAVTHARTDLRLRVELRGDLLHLAVRDGSPRLLRAWSRSPTRKPRDVGSGGRAARSRLGVNRHPDGGKVVWCTLNL